MGKTGPFDLSPLLHNLLANNQLSGRLPDPLVTNPAFYKLGPIATLLCVHSHTLSFSISLLPNPFPLHPPLLHPSILNRAPLHPSLLHPSTPNPSPLHPPLLHPSTPNPSLVHPPHSSLPFPSLPSPLSTLHSLPIVSPSLPHSDVQNNNLSGRPPTLSSFHPPFRLPLHPPAAFPTYPFSLSSFPCIFSHSSISLIRPPLSNQLSGNRFTGVVPLELQQQHGTKCLSSEPPQLFPPPFPPPNPPMSVTDGMECPSPASAPTPSLTSLLASSSVPLTFCSLCPYFCSIGGQQ
ncbi:unnamed protein product [Closterium sp. Naga37s-1]|nr:unnamed protein product [Closterium sp. Naga37s-1]